MNIKEHEMCMCAATEVQLALYEERQRLSEIVDAWIEKVAQHLEVEIDTDSLMFDSGWFPLDEKYCKLELNPE